MTQLNHVFNKFRIPNSPKKLIKPRSIGQFLIIFILFTLCYILGLFSHLLEKDLTEFSQPLKIDIRIALQTYDKDKKAVDYLDINKNKLNYSYIYKAEKICKPSKLIQTDPYLVILIKSKLTHFETRDVIRRTWGQSDQMKMIRKVFLVGLPGPDDEMSQNESILEKLENENQANGDIVQQDFLDTYYNNTVKTIMGIRWIVEYCANSKFYLFIDDDFYLNPKLLMSYLKNNVTDSMLSTFYAGYVFENSSPMRHLLSKWYISLEDYPYHKFPPYVSAGCYILSQESARLFYMASKLIELFKFDDIYMGILAHKLDIKPKHLSNVYYYAPTYYPSVYAREVIAAHGFQTRDLKSIWQQLKKFIKFE